MTITQKMGKLVATALILPILAVQTSQAEDLFTVYLHAKESDPTIGAAEASYLATLERLPQSLAALKPHVTLSGAANYKLSQTWSYAGSDGDAALSATYQLNLAKPLYRPQINEQIAQSRVSILQAEESLLAEQQNLILRVTEAYFNYLTARDSAQFSRSEASAVERQYKQVQAYFEAGRSAITDVKESQSRYDQAVASVVVADQNVDIALESLYALTGRYYRVLRGAGSSLPLVVPTPNNIAAWSDAAMSNNKSVKVAEYAAEVARKSVDVARAAKKPTIDMYVQHNGSLYDSEPLTDSESIDASIGVQFSMDLFDAGLDDAAIREARFTFRQALQQLESTRRSARQQARTYFLNIITGLSQVQSLKQSLESSQVAAKATQEGFRVGTRTAVDVLLALSSTYQAEQNYSAARYTFLLNTIRLKQAAGTLSEDDIRALSRILSRSQTTRLEPIDTSNLSANK